MNGVPPSLAREAFDKNLADVNRLLDIHRRVSGHRRGRRWGVSVLNRSAIVLLCATWEAYCEDIVGEVVEHFTGHAEARRLPAALRKKIAAEFRQADGMRMWSLADDGWKAALRERLGQFKEERDRGLNTPKPQNVKALFHEHAGYEDITEAWKWQGKSVDQAEAELIALVKLRGSIAHRVDSITTVNLRTVEKYMRLVGRLVETTDAAMQTHAQRITGEPLRPIEEAGALA